MKKNFFLFFLLTTLTVLGLSFSHTQNVAASIFDDSPDNADGFASGDPCGFVKGTSTPYRLMSINADGVSPDTDQACADASGYFYEYDYPTKSPLTDRDSIIQLEYALSAVTYTLNIDLVGSTYQTVVDQTTGRWSGYGYITDASYSGTNRWVWFDWTCSGVGGDCSSGAVTNASYRVKTDLNTGVITGYAWNDDLGFISFRNLTMELAPHDIQVYVDVLASDTDLEPNDVDLDTVPLADGYDYWRIRVQFWDDTAQEFLDESDFTTGTLSLAPTTIGEVFLNQVEDSGNAVSVETYNAAVGCIDSTAEYCSMTENDGSWSANVFVYSGAPTSDMTGMNMDTDLALENLTDREGCRWIYHDQWYEVDGATTQKNCPYPSGSTYSKDDVFYERQEARNMIGLESLGLVVSFVSDRNMSVSTVDGTLTSTMIASGEDIYTFIPTYNRDADGDGIEDGMYLSFKPRFTVTKFVAIYDGLPYTQFASDQSTSMYLSANAVLRNISDAAQNQGFAVALKPEIDVYYQLDAVSDAMVGASSANDKFFILDTADTGIVPDCGRRIDTLAEGAYGDYYFSGAAPYGSAVKAPYKIGYGQKNVACQGIAPTTTTMTNTVSDPTAEMWVCDSASVYRLNTPSCYYVAYLNIVDRHDDAADHPMTVFGAITSGVNDETVLTDTDVISILGNTETIKTRNVIYGQVVRYMLGQTASTGTLDSSMEPSSLLLELMNGRLVIAEGDVTVEGSSACSDKTLVTIGGNVYINGNITNCRLGVIALRVNEVGGNVYVAPDVTELYANFFLDGALYSYDGSTTYTDEPSWTNDETRVATLLNQLYINGSLSSRNTVNGADNTDGDGIYEVGDGTTTTNYDIAREHDLNMIRQFRLCYPLDATGIPDTSVDPSLCAEGEARSTYGVDNDLYNSFILDYAPADSLPVFRSQN